MTDKHLNENFSLSGSRNPCCFNFDIFSGINSISTQKSFLCFQILMLQTVIALDPDKLFTNGKWRLFCLLMHFQGGR